MTENASTVLEVILCALFLFNHGALDHYVFVVYILSSPSWVDVESRDVAALRRWAHCIWCVQPSLAAGSA